MARYFRVSETRSVESGMNNLDLIWVPKLANFNTFVMIQSFFVLFLI